MRLTLSLLLLGLATSASAETAYVTDQLRLGLHRAADTSDRSFRTLQSGQEVEILSRNRNYARVRLADGTDGYVKAAYLVTEKPAALIVDEARSRSERLAAELAQAKAQFARPAATIAALEQQVAEQSATLADMDAAVQALNETNARYVSRHEQYKYSLPFRWVAGAMTVSVVGGFLFGLWWFDYRSRKRHGGIRIY